MEDAVITLDTSGVFALLNSKDPDHERVKQAFLADRGPYLVPATVLCEVGYFMERKFGVLALTAFLDDLIAGGFELDCGHDDLGRMKGLIERYRDLPLGLTDAAVVACAERNGGGVLTLDARHFGVVAREGVIRLFPG